MKKLIIILLTSLLPSINTNAQLTLKSDCNCDSIFNDVYQNAHYFMLSFHKNKIPGKIKKYLRKNLAGGLNMSNPDNNFNKTDVYNPFLKERRLLMYARRNNRHIIIYEQGGQYLSVRVALVIEVSDNNFQWCENILAGSQGSIFIKQLFDPKMHLEHKQSN